MSAKFKIVNMQPALQIVDPLTTVLESNSCFNEGEVQRLIDPYKYNG